MDKSIYDIKKSIKRDIKKRALSKEDQLEYYNCVYNVYGSKIYQLVTPNSIQKKDLCSIVYSGKFEDIYYKYGEKIYNNCIDYMKITDIYSETGNSLKYFMNKIFYLIKHELLPFLLQVAIIVPPSIHVALQAQGYVQNQIHLNEIEKYLDNIENYADSVNDLNLSNIEILMKVTRDMWSNIQGYSTPKKDLLLYPGLDLADEDGVGVCRNMADDVARKLNAINPNYNARVLNVYLTGSGYQYANINTNIVEDETTLPQYDNQSENSTGLKQVNNIINIINDNIIKYTGNHTVVILDIDEDNVTLMLDPTNPGIGVLKDGKIIPFNITKNSTINEKVTPITCFIVREDPFGLSKQLLSSFKEPTLSIEELKDKYGLDAQNKALSSLQEKENSFKDTLVVHLSNNVDAIGNLNMDKSISKGDKKDDIVR